MAYICSRYYRAPELIFGATDYTVNIGKVVSKLPVHLFNITDPRDANNLCPVILTTQRRRGFLFIAMGPKEDPNSSEVALRWPKIA